MTWCGRNNVGLRALKTVQMVADFRKSAFLPTSIILCDSPLDTVDSLRFLEAIIYQELKLSKIVRLSFNANASLYVSVFSP